MVLCQVCNQPIDSDHAEHVSAKFCRHHYKHRSKEPVFLHSSEQAEQFLVSKRYQWVLVNSDNGTVITRGVTSGEYVGLFGRGNLLYSTQHVDKDFALRVGVKVIHVGKVEEVIPQAVKGESAADTVAMRESVYGPFEVHAKAEQDMKRAMTSQPGWEKLNDVQKSAAEMIVHKLARILNASPDYDDNWHDISGYANLAEKDIKNRRRTEPDSSESV